MPPNPRPSAIYPWVPLASTLASATVHARQRVFSESERDAVHLALWEAAQAGLHEVTLYYEEFPFLTDRLPATSAQDYFATYGLASWETPGAKTAPGRGLVINWSEDVAAECSIPGAVSEWEE